MNYNDLDLYDITKLLKDFFKNNPSFADPASNKAKILYDEQKDNLNFFHPVVFNDYYDDYWFENPLLVYTKGTSVKISEKFRGVLINDVWVIYCGERLKYYWAIRDLEPFGVPPARKIPKNYWSLTFDDGYSQFSAPDMVDITAYVFKSQQKFINWDKEPWSDKK